MDCTNLFKRLKNIYGYLLLIVFPSLASSDKYCKIKREVKESIPVVGSSTIIIGGSDIISYAIYYSIKY